MVASTPLERSRADQREKRLLDAARSILRERGFEADIRDILKQAGVGTGTAYRHFPNKEALVRTVIEEMCEATREGLGQASRIEDTRQAVARAMQVGFQMLAEYGQLAVILFAGTEPPEYRGAVDHRGMERYFASLLRRGMRDGQFRSDLDVDHAVGVWYAITAPNALSRLMEDQQRSVEEIAAVTTRFYLAGISA